MKLGLAVRAAVRARANLAGANLAGANLAGAYLAGAYLAGAYLAGANLAGANLADANLADANLAGAYLADAYLAGANLAGAKWRDGVPLTEQPIQVYGLRWPVTILDRHMQIGCQLHTLFDDEHEILASQCKALDMRRVEVPAGSWLTRQGVFTDWSYPVKLLSKRLLE